METAESNRVVSAFTEEQVERLTGITVHRLRYWDRTDFFRPSYGAENRRIPYSRIYSFKDIAALRVLSVLIHQHNVPLQHLRKVAGDLGAMDNSTWSRTTLYVFGRKVIFEDNDKKVEAGSGQYMIGIPLEKVVSDTRRDIKALSQREDQQIGQIDRNRFIAHNSVVVAGTRIPVKSIQHFAEDGFSVEQIMAEYPTLTEADIKAALAHEVDKAA